MAAALLGSPHTPWARPAPDLLNIPAPAASVQFHTHGTSFDSDGQRIPKLIHNINVSAHYKYNLDQLATITLHGSEQNCSHDARVTTSPTTRRQSAQGFSTTSSARAWENRIRALRRALTRRERSPVFSARRHIYHICTATLFARAVVSRSSGTSGAGRLCVGLRVTWSCGRTAFDAAEIAWFWLPSPRRRRL
jgi:hypothetical protein